MSPSVPRRTASPASVPVLFAAFALVLAACNGSDDADPGELEVTAMATVLEGGVPVSATSTQVRDEGDGVLAHEIQLTWDGDITVTVDDARFAHVIEGDEGGHIVTAGRGCGAEYDEDQADALIACTDDLQLIQLTPGGTHEYPVRAHVDLGELAMVPGRYVADETIEWFESDDPEQPVADGEEGVFTIRLTYEVD